MRAKSSKQRCPALYISRNQINFFQAILSYQAFANGSVRGLNFQNQPETLKTFRQPPRKKSRWIRGFKEDPFVFFTPTDVQNTFPSLR